MIMTVEPKTSPRWQGLRPTGKTLDNGIPELDKPIIVTCRHADHGICRDCAADLQLVLADVPELLDELDTAIAGEARFVEHGARAGGSESLANGSNPAVAAQQRLTKAMLAAGTWFDDRNPARLADWLTRYLEHLAPLPAMRRIGHDISSAAARAHRVIDAPPDLWHYGPCPDCKRDLWQERIRPDDHNRMIICRFPSCGYTATIDDHQRSQLKLADDRWMTVSELVAAFEVNADTPITRDQLNGWIRREGLPEEIHNRPRYVGGKLVAQEVRVYRVGDVRDMAVKADIRRRNAG